MRQRYEHRERVRRRAEQWAAGASFGSSGIVPGSSYRMYIIALALEPVV